MAQKWDYAELSRTAKMAGGPEKFVDLIETASKNAGKMEMLPWIGVSAVGASLLTTTTIKIVDYLKSKNAHNQDAIEIAKQEIIDDIKAYDVEHDNNNSLDN